MRVPIDKQEIINLLEKLRNEKANGINLEWLTLFIEEVTLRDVTTQDFLHELCKETKGKDADSALIVLHKFAEIGVGTPEVIYATCAALSNGDDLVRTNAISVLVRVFQSRDIEVKLNSASTFLRLRNSNRQ